MARTTLTIEDDAMEKAREYAELHGVSLGRAVSELLRRAAEQPLVTESKNGLAVVRLPERSPQVTSEQVARLTDEWP